MFEGVSRGYLPENFYSDRLVFKTKPPAIKTSPYPNKIEVGGRRYYALVVNKTRARLQDAYAWMSTHPYIRINYLGPVAGSAFTGNVVIEAYQSPERSYVMVVCRAATQDDERTNQIMQSHGHSQRRGPCPPPISAIICRSGVNLQSVWQWLSLHRGRLAYLVNEQFIRNTIAVTRPPLRDSDLNRTFDESVPTNTSRYVLYDEFNTRQARNLHGPVRSNSSMQHYLRRQLPRRHPSHESVDSTLPAYEPPPPSIHSSIPEDIRAEIEEIQRLQAEVAANGGGDHGFVSSSSELQSNESDSDTDEEHESTYLRIVPQAAAVAPPQYWDVADDTEYGRLHTVQDTVIDAYMDSAVTESTASDSLERPSTQSVQETTSQQQSAPTFTRTFTRSMPMLTSILDEGDEIEASIAQYRQRIIADSNNSAMVEPPSPPSPLPPLPAIVDSPPVPSASRTHVMRPTASHGTSLFGGINQHMRRSRLSAKTNPEYGKRSWFSRLLNM